MPPLREFKTCPRRRPDRPAGSASPNRPGGRIRVAARRALRDAGLEVECLWEYGAQPRGDSTTYGCVARPEHGGEGRGPRRNPRPSRPCSGRATLEYPLPRERDLLSPRFCCISAPVPIWLRGSGLDFLLARRTSRTDNSRRVRRHPPMTIGRKLASARRDGVSNFARPVRLRRAGRAVEFASPPGGRCATRGVERERRRRMEFRRRA